jgi:hypothetical protein
LFALIFIFVAARVHASDPSYSVRDLTLELGEERVVELDGGPFVAAHSSSDRIVSARIEGKLLRLKALDFGRATVVVVGELANDISSVTVPTRPVVMPRLRQPVASGTGILLGTRVGFRDKESLFGTRVVQEEFLRMQVKEDLISSSGHVVTASPLFYAEPKPLRTVDAVSLGIFRNDHSWGLRFGDLDPFQKLAGGPVRGLRADLRAKNHAVNAWAGVLRSGIDHALFGRRASAIVGAEDSWRMSPGRALSVHALSFKAHPELRLPSDGMEAGVKFHAGSAWLGGVDAGLVSDKSGALAFEGSTLLDLNLMSLSLSAFHAPDDHQVYSRPSRFGPAQDGYALSLTAGPAEGVWRLGGGYGSTLVFAAVDEYPGITRLQSVSSQLSVRASDRLQSLMSYSFYDSYFEPFSYGLAQVEKGHQIEAGSDWEYRPRSFVTVSVIDQAAQSSRDETSYETRQFFAGLKRKFFAGGEDFLHLQAGAGRFHYPTLLSLDGHYWLTRVSGLWDHDWLKLEGQLQSELRLTDQTIHTMRAQAGFKILPDSHQELSIALTHYFEWARNVYSKSRGVFFSYVYHFGEIARSTPRMRAKKCEITGRVFLDVNGNGVWDDGDRAFAESPVRLSGQGVELKARTDVLGEYRFPDLCEGNFQIEILRVDPSPRLVSESPRIVEAGDRADFIFTAAGEIAGSVFNDLNENFRLDDTEPLVTGVTVGLTDERGETTGLVAEDGRFRFESVSPGPKRLFVEEGSLPIGFRADKPAERSLVLSSSTIVREDMAIVAERGVAGRLFVDVNGNGHWDKGDKPIDGEWVRFGTHKTLTGEGGRFIFRHLPPLSGVVRFRNAQSPSIELGAEPALITDVLVPVRP